MSWSLVSWVLINRGLIHWGLLLNMGSLDLTLVVAIPTVLVLVPTILIVGLVVVLHGRKTEWSNLVRHRWRTVTGISLVKIYCGCLRNHILQLSNIGRYSGGGNARTHLSNNGFASGVTNFGLAFDDA
ncbi:hypothetical protein Tco_0181668 [Tanacetum coccineum]